MGFRNVGDAFVLLTSARNQIPCSDVDLKHACIIFLGTHYLQFGKLKNSRTNHSVHEELPRRQVHFKFHTLLTGRS